MKVNHETYVPFYSLGFAPPSNLPVSRILTGNYEADPFEATYGTEVTSEPNYLKFLKKCIEKKYYSLILMLAPTKQTGNRLRSTLQGKFEAFISNPYATHFTSYMAIMGSSALQDIFDRTRLFNGWAASQYKFRKAEPKTYISNMYFLAEMPGRVTQVTSELKALFSMMIKKTSVPMVRACFATNTPIPASLLELWIDNSIEGTGSNMKPYFRKHIKHKLENAGVSIKYFDNLTNEIISVQSMPLFNTVADKTKWQQDKLKEFYRMEQGYLGYSENRPTVVPSELITLQDRFRAMVMEVSSVEEIVPQATVEQTTVLQNVVDGLTSTASAMQGYVTFDEDAPF